ncbi:hypothetical protein NUW58_g213 [Xylaria curta]|uniref:Uncharacterized protein n=1 Tax=Xylaria curta TaxID=42375 RepID=A0ACC1PRQ3_9PEZI|nr:hypothetical protein NUW58_g213 [Xylaria curta]
MWISPNVRQTTELRGHAAPIEKVAFNPAKELELCSVSSDGVVRFWDVKNKVVLNEIRGLGETFTLAWAPHGEYVVVGNKENKLFVLSPTESAPISAHQQSTMTNDITFCWSAFSWDGLFIVGGSEEGTGLEFTVSETGEHLCTYKTRTPSPVVAWAPNRYALAYTDMGSLRIIGASPGGK